MYKRLTAHFKYKNKKKWSFHAIITVEFKWNKRGVTNNSFSEIKNRFFREISLENWNTFSEQDKYYPSPPSEVLQHKKDENWWPSSLRKDWNIYVMLVACQCKKKICRLFRKGYNRIFGLSIKKLRVYYDEKKKTT